MNLVKAIENELGVKVWYIIVFGTSILWIYSYNAFRADITDQIDLTCTENIVCNLLQAEVANLRHLRYSFMIWSNMMASEPTAPSFGQVKIDLVSNVNRDMRFYLWNTEYRNINLYLFLGAERGWKKRQWNQSFQGAFEVVCIQNVRSYLPSYRLRYGYNYIKL